jgi:hypothetical protein
MRSLAPVVAAALACAALAAPVSPAAAADPVLRPYVLASEGAGPLADVVARAREALAGAGFQVAGEYPLSGTAHVLVATSPALQAAAAGTPDGAYGAVVRVAATKVGEAVQVSYTNPAWMAGVYRLAAEPEGVGAALARALGKIEEFGSKDGLTAAKLRAYHYMVFMPYFNEQVLLGTFPTQAEAVARVEAGLAAGRGARKIYRVDLPGADQSVIGVAVLAGEGADAQVMQTCDTGARRHTAHLPYEVLVAGGKVRMLHGKFRIAQSFPDLTMGTFMKISGAPDGIEAVLRDLLK